MKQRGRLCAAFACVLALWLLRGGSSVLAAGHSVFVPWKVLNTAEDRVAGQLILYWIPASRDDIRRSLLLTSRPLAMYAARCVGMQVVRPDDVETLRKLQATEAAPAAILVDGSGSVIARVAGESSFSCSAVEKMVHDGLIERLAAIDRALDEARTQLEAGEREKAAELYRGVHAQRCLSPAAAREAERALKKLAPR